MRELDTEKQARSHRYQKQAIILINLTPSPDYSFQIQMCPVKIVDKMPNTDAA